MGIFVAGSARSEIELSDLWMAALSVATVLLVFGLFLRVLVRNNKGNDEEDRPRQSLVGLIGLGILATLVLRNIDVIFDRDTFVWLVGLAAVGIAAASFVAAVVRSWRSR